MLNQSIQSSSIMTHFSVLKDLKKSRNQSLALGGQWGFAYGHLILSASLKIKKKKAVPEKSKFLYTSLLLLTIQEIIMFNFLKKLFGNAQSRLVNKYRGIVATVNDWEEKYQSLDDTTLRGKTEEFKRRLKEGETVDQILPEVYAVVKNACRRLFGQEIHVSGYDQKWDMIPYDVQILGAIAMHHGAIAEMKTGEGKTLTATMPLYLNALTGQSSHLITVNDYLALRDSQWMGSIFRWLGLTVGALTNDVPPNERQAIYACDIVYGTASEFGFDYLRDNSMALYKEDQVQRGYYFAMIDEVDSILIDEARTPLIISGPVPESRQMYDSLQGLAASLVQAQKNLCNCLATEARKDLELLKLFTKDDEEAPKLNKEQKKKADFAYRKLWLVSKGTPRHKSLKRVLENPDMRYAIDQWDIYYHSDQNKEERSKSLAELFIIIDERNSEYELTDKGILEWERQSDHENAHEDFLMLDMGEEYEKIDSNLELSEDEKLAQKIETREKDAHRKERSHNIRQLLKAHLLMEKDVDYIIQDEKVVIIDENTGRPQPGRRFSEGLHQAIEAKEHVPIQKETQTYASITLQNYFRMYERLSGMTGTAMTEAHEFKEIYNLEVLEIPTNVPCIRKDANDEIYMTEREKYVAICKEVEGINQKGCPVLIGTESVETSEILSRIFRRKRLQHTVLNAKHHEHEAEIIADAGQEGAITIATNMAGRGTDIKLGKGIAEAGGLHVIGTTRHSSRRIDRQLRGRSSRQGDPGCSKFYVSFEDSLMRLFASPGLTSMLKKLRPPEGEPISAGILTRSIETAQKRIEQRNFTIRKHTLEYDDVMNMQRKEIYSFRNSLLQSEDIRLIAFEIISETCQSMAEEFFETRADESAWDPEGYRQWLVTHFPVTFEEGFFDDDHSEIEVLENKAIERLTKAYEAKLHAEEQKIKACSDGDPILTISEGIRSMIIHKLNKVWQEHLLVMDYLRSEVRMRTVGQKDPLTEFKYEAFALFDDLSRHLRADIAESLFRMEIITPVSMLDNFLPHQMKLETKRSFLSDLEANMEPAAVNVSNKAAVTDSPVLSAPKVGRNDNCPCGSGKKYKKCCGINELSRGRR